MKKLIFSAKDAMVSQQQVSAVAEKLRPEIARMNAAAKMGYKDDRAFINLPIDKKALAKVKQAINAKKKLKPEYVIHLGIGGSNLGTLTVKEAVMGKLYNELNPKTKILFAGNNADSDDNAAIMKIIGPVLKKRKNIVINCVSKSGGTTETIASFQILMQLLKKYKKDYGKYVVVTTDNGSRLWNLAMEQGFTALEIPKKVEGRYSVFTPVGLFSLGMIGIDINGLLKGAAAMRKACMEKNISKNPAALSAALIYIHYKQGKNINVLFPFSDDLGAVGRWYRQLMGESVGKEFDLENKRVFMGITPTAAVGSTDLHSMAQLYLGGPFDKFTAFIEVKKSNSRVAVPIAKEYAHLVDHIQGKSVEDIMGAILQGVQIAYKKNKRPFVEVVIPDKSASSIGQLLQFKMMEMIYLGHLLNVNPFDQPNVEAYKIETKKILAKKR